MSEQLNENAQTDCLKCGVEDDVANMKADGHGKFLCIECAYKTLRQGLRDIRDSFIAPKANTHDLRLMIDDILEGT